MITLNGIEYYTATDLTKYLNMKYSSVIALLAKFNTPKYKKNYIVNKELAEKIKERENRTPKIYDISENYTYNEIIANLKRK